MSTRAMRSTLSAFGVTLLLLAAGAPVHAAAPVASQRPALTAFATADAYRIRTSFRRPAEGLVPLRHGTSAWGYVHIRHSHGYVRGLIRLTLGAGRPVSVDGTSTTYAYEFKTPDGKFKTGDSYRVVVQWAPTRRDGRPKGIITAYPVLRV